MQQILLIALGGSLGAVARYWLATSTYNTLGENFPWGTITVNLTGSLLIGIFIGLSDIADIPTEWRTFMTIGFLGSYTTFSTYTLETINLVRDGEIGLATMNVLYHNVGGFILVILGIYISRILIKHFS